MLDASKRSGQDIAFEHSEFCDKNCIRASATNHSWMKKMNIRLNSACALVLFMIVYPGAVIGQAYPTKPIRVITATSGGSLDVVLRMIGNGISGPLGRPIVVEN